jgi:hypothetical protein
LSSGRNLNLPALTEVRVINQYVPTCNNYKTGRGAIPRWAYHSLQFLVLISNPDSFTTMLNDEEFKVALLYFD